MGEREQRITRRAFLGLVQLGEGAKDTRRRVDVAALVAEKAFSSLRAPIKLVTAPHAPVPFAPNLEDAYIPDASQVEAAVRWVISSSK